MRHFSLIAAVLCASAYSQTMQVHLSGGQTVAIGLSEIQKITFSLGATGTRSAGNLPEKVRMALRVISPSPLCPTTTVRYRLAKPAHVSVVVYSSQGRIVRTLVEQVQSSGDYALTWDRNSDQGPPVGTGCFVIRAKADGQAVATKLILAR